MAEFTLPKNSQIQKGRHWASPGAKEPRTFKVYRWNPDDGMNPRVDTYEVDMASCGPMVLDALIKFKAPFVQPLISVAQMDHVQCDCLWAILLA